VNGRTQAVDPGAARLSVVIVTWNRPDYVRNCLGHLARQSRRPSEIVVVDASADEATATIVDSFPAASYVSFPGGAGHMTTSRNVGLLHVSGDIVAFLDDDAFVRPGWAEALVAAFADARVGAVAGRTCNGVPDEERVGVEAIGRLLSDGNLTGNFAADPGALIDVDHGIGANMSFRREALLELGGFRDDFGGVGGVREDTDMFLRLRALGYRAVFSPTAVVDHVGAPHIRGRRFDYRYAFWSRRNHMLLLARNFGLGSPEFGAYTTRAVRHPVGGERSASSARRAARAVIGIAGVVAGGLVSVRKARWRAVDPSRRNGDAEAIRLNLGRAVDSYTNEFFAALQASSLSSARCVVPIVLDVLDPQSVIDVGCGTGAWLSVFAEHGVVDYLGIDGDYVDRSALLVPSTRFLAHDVEVPLELERSFDLAVSLEVAEHLPPSCAGAFISWLTRLAPAVLFSAAVPGQGGVRHVNEQWPSSWASRFAAHGFAAIDVVRPRVWANLDVDWWYAQNTLLFMSAPLLETLTSVPAPTTELGALDLVHPRSLPSRSRAAPTTRELLALLPHAVEGSIARRRPNRT
jgi:GT2 family glycosyltransferase/SAM-dependent methyltransferase